MAFAVGSTPRGFTDASKSFEVRSALAASSQSGISGTCNDTRRAGHSTVLGFPELAIWPNDTKDGRNEVQSTTCCSDLRTDGLRCGNRRCVACSGVVRDEGLRSLCQDSNQCRVHDERDAHSLACGYHVHLLRCLPVVRQVEQLGRLMVGVPVRLRDLLGVETWEGSFRVSRGLCAPSGCSWRVRTNRRQPRRGIQQRIPRRGEANCCCPASPRARRQAACSMRAWMSSACRSL